MYIFKRTTSFLIISIGILSAYLAYFYAKLKTDEQAAPICRLNYATEKVVCWPACENGSFGLPGMTNCHPWITCNNIHEVKAVQLLISGVVKNIYLAEWADKIVILSNLSAVHFDDDFKNHVHTLKMFGPNNHTVQLIGFCNNTIVTEYHKLGNAMNVHKLLKENFTSKNDIKTRFSFCLHYVKILVFLHNSPLGIRVMCDSSDLLKTLSQYLITDDFHLVLNDLDALPEVNHCSGQKIKCGHKQLTGNFVAPEQLWPYVNEPYNDSKMHLYDEKTDIWKIPDICNWFLGQDKQSEIVKFMLFDIHKQCKDVIPHRRPTAPSVLRKYNEVWHEIMTNFF